MRRYLAILSLLCLAANPVKSQIFPSEASVINYRLVGFSFPRLNQSIGYRLEIAECNCNSIDQFKAKIISRISDSTNKIIAEVPAFGSHYTWRITTKLKNGTSTTGPLNHFITGSIPEVDTTATRIRVVRQAKKYTDAFVFVDNNKALYNMSGRPVWYLPEIKGVKQTPNSVLRDLKLTPFSSISFLLDDKAYEINYNGDVLWTGPDDGTVSAGTTEHYHHEFTRLTNGHFMVLGEELPLAKQKLSGVAAGSDSFYNSVAYGTVIEYDEKGKIVWAWKSSGYFIGSDIKYFTIPQTMTVFDVHQNAFYFDEQNKVIYISFRHIGRILKIKYPEGTVLAAYGEKFKKGIPNAGNGVFCGQHSVRHSPNGYLYLFNNGCDPQSPPKVSVLKEPVNDSGGLEVLWQYQCNLEGLPEEHHKTYWYPIWGNVVELPDSSLFVCTGSDHTKLFIVSRSKDELWSAVPEKWFPEKNEWHSVPQYRSGIIYDRRQMDGLIWNAGQN